MEFIVGTFNTQQLFHFRFTPPGDPSTGGLAAGNARQSAIEVSSIYPAVGSHSWLALSPAKTHLYATAWLDKPSVASYRLELSEQGNTTSLALLNTKPVASQPGYVAASDSHLYSCGGPSGEIFELGPDGSIGNMIQSLSFLDDTENQSAKRGAVAHGDFGGLRHGSHSIDLSPDGKMCYVADIGRNCIWCYDVQRDGKLVLGEKKASPREGDGPRHVWPHANGKIVYVVQEHSSMVDVFEILTDDGVRTDGQRSVLRHVQSISILPQGHDPKRFWADEVRTSRPPRGHPRYLYASTRGLQADTNGYVCAFELDDRGHIVGQALDMWETPTSGGIANAVEPAPMKDVDDKIEYLALTDSEEGWVFVLSFDGHGISLIEKVRTVAKDGGIAKAATAVWL